MPQLLLKTKLFHYVKIENYFITYFIK